MSLDSARFLMYNKYNAVNYKQKRNGFMQNASKKAWLTKTR